MNKLDIQLLQSVRGYPAVSILMPTHRTAPENNRDPILLKNLAKEATERLLSEFSKREAEPVLRRLEAIVEDVSFNFTLDGLAIFVNTDFARKFYIPFELKPRVVIDETFATRDLVYAMNRTPRYWVLSLADNNTRLFEAVRDDLTEAEHDAFPMDIGHHGGERGAQRERLSEGAYRDEFNRQFMREVANNLEKIRESDPLPVAVVGVERSIAYFREVMPDKKAIIATLTGNHEKTNTTELGKLIWAEVKQSLEAERQAKLETLRHAVGARRFVSGAGEVWRYAHDGRGDLLLVEDNFYYPARLDESGRHITPAEDVEAPDVIDDAVDEIIEAVLQKGGTIGFVPDGTLKDHQGIALILRY